MKVINLRARFAAALVGAGLLSVAALSAQAFQSTAPVSYRAYQPAAQPRQPSQPYQPYARYQDNAPQQNGGPIESMYSAADQGYVSEDSSSVAAGSCDTGGCGLGRQSELGDPWTLFGSGCEDPWLKVGGWVQGGYHDESNDLFNSTPDRFNVHQTWLFLEKEAVSENGELGLGFRFDGMYGIDYNDTQAFGNPVRPGGGSNWDNGPAFTRGGGYGWAMPQAYLEVAKGDWSTKIGHFYTLIGYEVVTAPDNFFYSHALTMYNSEPFTHTGVLTSYAASDDTTIYGGWTAGWDTGFDQFGDGSNFLGGISTSLGEYVSAAYMTTIGNFGARGADGYMHSIVLDMTLTEKMNYVFQTDLLRVGSTGEDTFGINQYLFYDISDRLKLGSRIEWWKADSLTGYGPHGGTVPATGSLSYYESTTGFNYKLNSNIVVRPEYRYDWSEGANYDQGIFGIDFVATY